MKDGRSLAEGSKRKAVDEDICSSIKRFRISYTPGEIRLSKDLEDLKGFPYVNYQLTSNPASVVLEFDNAGLSSSTVSKTPKRFLVTVPRFYPHSKPLVKCLDIGYSDKYIDASGTVCHPLLGDDWTAVGGVVNIVQVLESIRGAHTAENGFPQGTDFGDYWNSTITVSKNSSSISNCNDGGSITSYSRNTSSSYTDLCTAVSEPGNDQLPVSIYQSANEGVPGAFVHKIEPESALAMMDES